MTSGQVSAVVLKTKENDLDILLTSLAFLRSCYIVISPGNGCPLSVANVAVGETYLHLVAKGLKNEQGERITNPPRRSDSITLILADAALRRGQRQQRD